MGLRGLNGRILYDAGQDPPGGYSGAVVGPFILVDGEGAETQEDAVMVFDRSAIRGAVLPPPAPTGMWAGHLAPDVIVTIEPKGDPARARVLRATPTHTTSRHLAS